MTAKTAQRVVNFIETELPFVTWNIFTAEELIVKNRVVKEQNIVKAYAKNGRAADIDCGVSADKMLCMCTRRIRKERRRCFQKNLTTSRSFSPPTF